MSNIQSLNLKLNNGLHLDSPILLKSKINFTKVSAREKIHTQKKIQTYLNLTSTLLQKTKDSCYKQYFRDNQNKSETSMADHKGDDKYEKQI